MTTKPKVFLTGGDNENWGLDDDLRLTRRALADVVEFTTNIQACDVVHAMWWDEIARTPEEWLRGKRIVSHMPGEPFRYLAEPGYSAAAAKVSHWIVHSRQAQDQVAIQGQAATLIPYTCDRSIFKPLPAADPALAALQAQWGIPAGAYLIGNFHRDTEGSDLTSPKLVKGPDIFVEIVRGVMAQHPNVHVVLAGPRRFWVRRALDDLHIPYTFVGERTEGRDDTDRNILPQPQLNLLYNLIDLYIVSSRSEGGPRSVAEAALARCKIVSTPVGIAPDLLDPACLYRYPHEAVATILEDIHGDRLAATVDANERQAQAAYVPEAATHRFSELYAHWQQWPVYHGPQAAAAGGPLRADQFRPRPTSWKQRVKYQLRRNPVVARLWRRVIRPQLDRRKRAALLAPAQTTGASGLTVSLWHDFRPPPYGGGNQFMLALRNALLDQHVRVVENQVGPGIDAYLLNSVQFDLESFAELQARQPLAVVHRIDGPIYLVRGKDREQDELCFHLNARLASATVLQSYWTYQRILEMGYRPVNPVVVHNAVNPAIFHVRGRIAFSRDRKIRLISSSWSDNPRKGGPLYKWLEEHLDWDRFEYTFVGRASEQFERIRTVDPVPSEQLADLLRQHDIYITASQNDPCSNALIEALACGLPALYLDDGGHPELVGQGGLPFHGPDDLLAQLDCLVEHYESFQNLIAVPKMDDVARRYLALLQDAADQARARR